MINQFLKENLSSKDQTMEPLTPTFLFKMKTFMKVGTTILGQSLQNIKSTDTIDSVERLPGLA